MASDGRLVIRGSKGKHRPAPITLAGKAHLPDHCECNEQERQTCPQQCKKTTAWKPMSSAVKKKDNRILIMSEEEHGGTQPLECRWFVPDHNDGVGPRWMPWCGNLRLQTTDHVKPLYWVEVPR